MRILPVLVALGAAVTLSACTRTYVERTTTAPAPAAVITPAPTVVTPAAPPPTVTVRPSY
jgi:hypothetical protein